MIVFVVCLELELNHITSHQYERIPSVDQLLYVDILLHNFDLVDYEANTSWQHTRMFQGSQTSIRFDGQGCALSIDFYRYVSPIPVSYSAFVGKQA